MYYLLLKTMPSPSCLMEYHFVNLHNICKKQINTYHLHWWAPAVVWQLVSHSFLWWELMVSSHHQPFLLTAGASTLSLSLEIISMVFRTYETILLIFGVCRNLGACENWSLLKWYNRGRNYLENFQNVAKKVMTILQAYLNWHT